MSGLRLLLKSRRTAPLLLALAAIAVVSRELSGQPLFIGASQPIPLPWPAVLPAITAYLTATAAWSTQPLLEHLAERRVDLYDLLYLTAVVSIGTVLVAWAAQPISETSPNSALYATTSACSATPCLVPRPSASQWVG